MVSKPLMTYLRENFALEIDGGHGARHWGRVKKFGLQIAKSNGADSKVVELFAVLHDSCRCNDLVDPYHGMRAGERVHFLNGSLFDLTPLQVAVLSYACAYHSDGFTTTDPTVGACWDADRLDLPRYGSRVDLRLLSTQAARDITDGFPAFRRFDVREES